jgi:hypothetical protein
MGIFGPRGGKKRFKNMRKEFTAKLKGDEPRANATASFTLPFDTRDVWGKTRVPVKVTINSYTWRRQSGTGAEISASSSMRTLASMPASRQETP